MAKKIVDETLKFTILINGDEAKKEYGQLERQNRKLKQSTKDLEEQAKKLEQANKSNTQEYQKLKQEIEQNNQAVEKNQQRMGQLTKEIGLSNMSMRQLRKEASKLNGIISNLDPNSEDWKQYTSQLQAVNGRMSELRGEMRETNKSMSEQATNLGILTAGFGQFFSGLKSGNYKEAAAGLQAVGAGVKNVGKSLLAFVATPVGAVITALAGIGLAAKSWFDYNNQVVEALKLTRSITGLTDEAADQARIRAEALVDVFGVDFQETMETARNISQQFGIGFSEAFDAIEDGLVRGQKVNGEYFDSLKEYPTFFSQAGFSALEFQKVISTGYDLGIYTDKLPDAIKEFDISIKEQTKSTRDALINAFGQPFTDELLQKVKTGEITTKQALEQISDQAYKSNINLQQNAQLTADLFRGAGEDAGGAIKIFEAYNQALGENQRTLTESEQITKQQVEATKELKAVSSALFTTGDQGFGLLIDKARLFGTKILVDIISYGIDVVNWLITLNNKTKIFSGYFTILGKLIKAPFTLLANLIQNAAKSFGSLGDVLKGVFTFDFDLIKKGFTDAVDNTKKMISNLKDTAVKDFEDIKNAFADKSQTKLITVNSITTDESTSAPGAPTRTTSGGGSGELTEEDKKKLESRKKLQELLDQFEEEQGIKEQLKKVEKEQRQEEEEILRTELKYQKLIEEAEFDQELKAGFENALQLELQEIRDKYGEERFEKEQQRKEELQQLDQEFKDNLIAAENNYQSAKAQALNFGLNNLKNFFGEQTALGKAFFLFQQAAAVSDVINQVAKSKAQITASTAIANAKAIAASPLTGGQPWVSINTAAAAKNIAASTITGAVQIGSILANTIKGFEEGLYPVKRQQDGKKFNARFGGAPTTQIVNQPTILTGEMPEMIIDPQTFNKMDSNVIDYILQLSGNRPLGFESGYYKQAQPDQSTTPKTLETSKEQQMLQTALLDSVLELNQNLKRGLKINYTLDDEKQRQEFEDKLNKTQNQSIS